MKRLQIIPILALLLFLELFSLTANAQNGVLIDYLGNTRDNSAVLDVRSADQGVLVPRVDIVDLLTAAPVTSPAAGLLVYNTNATSGTGYHYWNGSRWTRLLDDVGTNYLSGSGVATRVAFWNGTNSLSSNANLFWDNPNSRLGIGTAGPLGSLDVRVSGSGTWNRLVVKPTSLWGDGLATAAENGGVEYVTIGAGGAAGIMLSNPHVVWNGGNNAAAIRYGRSGGIASGEWWEAGVNSGAGFHIRKGTTSASGIEILTGGNVGIGTALPGYKLHVAGTFGTNGWATIGDGQTGRLNLEVQPTFHRLAFNELRFFDWNLGGDNLTINNGNIGIAETAPDDRLSVLPAGGNHVKIGGGAATGSELKLTNNGTAHFSIYNRGDSRLTFANSSAAFQTNTAGSVLGYFDAAGNLTVTGSILGGPAGQFIQNQWGGNQSANFHISGSGRAGADLRAPIFYDENNTAFYTDPNGTSLINKIRVDGNGSLGGHWGHDPYGYGWGAPYASFRNLEVSSSGNYSNEPAMLRIHQWGSGAAEFWKPQGTNLYLRETPGGGGGWFTRFVVQGKQLVHSGSIPNGWDQTDWGSLVSFRRPGSGNMAGASHVNSQLELVSEGAGTAHISFHRPGLYGANFGLDSDNWFSTQGWSAGGGYTPIRMGSAVVNGNLTVTGSFPGDNLGNHLATTTLNMNSSSITNSAEVYTNGWFRNNVSARGLYNQATGNHWYSESTPYWNIGGNNGTNTGIIFRAGYQGAIQGYVYSDGAGFGLLHNGGGWNYRTWNGGQEMYGQTLAGWSGLYANIMYDRDNSGYYVDPHSNTYINSFQNNNTLLGWPGYNGMTQGYGHYVWPGRNDGSGAWWQQSWYLAGNSSYGLYTNTGMYFAGTTYHQNGGAFAGSAYNRDWGVGAGTTYGKVYSNWDNQNAGGITVSDDGGFYDYNDAWIQFQGSNGLQVSTSSGSYFMLFRTDRPGCCYDKQIIPQNANWGFVGTSGNYFYRMYAGGFVNGSTRESKRNITPLDEPTYELVMKDIDKIKPSFYKYNEELDELIEGRETKYRPNYHLGVITDESPDYIQDESFKGIDVYAIATLGLAGVKYNRAEIQEIKEAVGISQETTRVQDFGSFGMTGTEMTIKFRDSFSSKLNQTTTPVVTLTTNKLDVKVAVSKKDRSGFTVIASGNTDGLVIDYAAFAEIEKAVSTEQEKSISPELMKGLVIDESIKTKVNEYWAKQKEDLEKSIIPGSSSTYIPSEAENVVPHAADPDIIVKGALPNPDPSVRQRAEEAEKTYTETPEDGPARGGYLPEQNPSKDGAPKSYPVETETPVPAKDPTPSSIEGTYRLPE